MKGEDAEGAADLGLTEGGGFGFPKGAEFAGTAFDDGARDFVRKRGGFGTRALRERENVEIGEGEALDEGERGGVIVFGFAGKTGDEVGAEGRVWEAFAHEFDAAGIVLGAIPAVHGGEDAVGGGLQRHMEVLGDATGGSKKVDEVLRDVERLNGADAEALDWCFAEDAPEKLFEFDAGRKIAAVGAEIDTAENDLAGWKRGAQRFGADRQECLSHCQAADFFDCFVWWQTAALAADEGDDAVRTAGVAAVLDFEGRAGVIPFPAEDGSGGEFRAVEDVASKYRCERGRIGRGKLRSYKGMARYR